MPTPNPGEQRKDYIPRCMNYPEMKEKHPDVKQRVAVCYGLWKEHKAGHSIGEAIAEKVATPYGLCPTCGSAGVSTERRPNGITTCEAGHKHYQNDMIH